MDQIILVQEEPRGPSQLIEIPVTANGLQRIPIPDIYQLRSQGDQKIIMKGMRLITAEVLTNAVISAGVCAPVAELQKMTLVLYCDGWEKAMYIPVLTMNDMTTQAGALPHRYAPTRFDNWVNVDWSKSFLQYANATVTANTPYVVMFDVLYQKFVKNASGDWVMVIGPS